VVSFTPQLLYPQGKSPWYPLDRRLSGPRAILDTVVKRKRDLGYAYKILVEKPKEMRTLVRPGCRWEDIKVALKEIGCEDVDWIHLVQDRIQWQAVMNMVINL